MLVLILLVTLNEKILLRSIIKLIVTLQNTHVYYMLAKLYSCQMLSWSWSHGSWFYNYLCNRCLSSLDALDTTLCDKNSQWLAAGRWFSLGSPVSSTNKSDRQDVTAILLKVAFNTIILTLILFMSNRNNLKEK
jgi:hypothetical protein